uniref:NADH dehydrogenase subunit 7 n=1 Tax=Paramecium gigas TaxID=2709424 RepID=UPI001D027781|nr:NADH dehydrogenase subunit 7 [Paramecium gigas]QVG61509.1 NADH dehydrogenase subunit 7 [Paramecium gigas]
MNRSIFQNWEINSSFGAFTKSIKAITLNFGPQHPAAHGVLRLILQLSGEIIEKTDIHIGLLHRGTEKLIEDRLYLQSVPYFDRLDYVSMLVQEHAFCLAIESLMCTINYSAFFTLIRTTFDELTRILNHMLAIACHALDVGSMSSVFWAFEEREKIMEFYERVCGARMHAAFYRPNEVNINAITQQLLLDILNFNQTCLVTLNEMHNILTYNKIWKQRLVNVGSISYKDCINYGLTGVMARSTGIKRDLRMDKYETYANYYHLNFRVFTGQHGDSYDRFLIRMNEMSESLYIISQTIFKLNSSNYSPLALNKQLNKKKIISTTFKNEYNSMEKLIKHFKYWSEGFIIKANYAYQAVESPKGEFGVTLISDDTNKPYKCKIRSPAYHHLQVLPKLSKGHLLADLAALIGTVDIVFGEIDR